MDVRADIEIHGGARRHRSSGDLIALGVGSGLVGGAAMAAPIVIWDALRSGHLAFELPMAATAWLFGLRHFSHTQYLDWSVVVGVVLLIAYAALSGLVFAALVDRLLAVERPLSTLAGGFAWGFVSFIFFWDMLLPIARGGAPFRAVPGTAAPFVAPTWTWILGFTLLGLLTGACYAALQGSPSARDDIRVERPPSRSPVRRAA